MNIKNVIDIAKKLCYVVKVVDEYHFISKETDEDVIKVSEKEYLEWQADQNL